MFRYYILTSGPLWSLERQFTFLKTNETVVVINSLDKEYVDEAAEFCARNNIEHYVTDSDGTPSTGKNSVLKIFLASDYDYMVHVDGDDIITPYGRNLYRTVANSIGETPDVICLANQLAVQTPQEDFFDLFRNQVDSLTVKRKHFYISPKNNAHHTHSLTDRGPHRYTPKVSENEIDRMVADGISREVAQQWLHHRKVSEEYAIDYGDKMNTLNRLVFFSKRSAEMMHYDKHMVIGEDVLQYYELKKLSYEGKIDMVVRNEYPCYSYLYMQDVGSITRNGVLDLSWIEGLVTKLNNMDMFPQGYRLREFNDPYYEVK